METPSRRLCQIVGDSRYQWIYRRYWGSSVLVFRKNGYYWLSPVCFPCVDFFLPDVCGALISEDSTLIPATHFASTGNLEEDIRLFRDPTKSFDTYANYAVFLGATCVCYLHDYNNRTMNENDFADKWTELYHLLDDWDNDRPDEMRPILTIPAEERKERSPFPTVLYGNGPAGLWLSFHSLSSAKLS